MLAALAAAGRLRCRVCDPPAFAPSKQALEKGLRAYERLARLAAPLVAAGRVPGALFVFARGRPGAFRAACTRGIGKAGRAGQLIRTGQAGPDHPQLPQLAEPAISRRCFFALCPERAGSRSRCVLYPTVMREIAAGRGRTGRLHAAVVGAHSGGMGARGAQAGPGGEAQAREIEAALLRARWPRAEVAVPARGGRLWLPDPADRHVLAAAVAGSADERS